MRVSKDYAKPACIALSIGRFYLQGGCIIGRNRVLRLSKKSQESFKDQSISPYRDLDQGNAASAFWIPAYSVELSQQMDV